MHPRHRKNMSGERREGGGVGDKRRGSGKRGVWRETWVSRAIKKCFYIGLKTTVLSDTRMCRKGGFGWAL